MADRWPSQNKLTRADVKAIRERALKHESRIALAKEYGVSAEYVALIVRGYRREKVSHG